MSLGIVVGEETPTEAVDAFVREVDRGTFCHHSAWARVMERAMGHEYRALVARSGGDAHEVLGVLPLVEMRSLFFGKHLVSMPFLNYGGPLGAANVQRELVTHAVELARSRGVDSLQLRSWPPMPDDLDEAFADDREKVTVLLDLPGDPETLWTDFKGKVRSQVRRPTKDGMEARVGPDQLDAFYKVFARNMRDLGTPVHPRAFFEEVAAAFGEDVIFGAVYADGVPVAGSCGFVFGSEYEMTWASSLREFNRSAPNMLLYWTCMEEAIRRGLTRFNFGRCTPDGGTHRFKLQWGGYDETLHWKRWTPGHSAPEESSGEKGGLFDRAIQVWQRLPMPVANQLGPIVCKRIPWY